MSERAALTLLYVPADRPERIDKALASSADVVIIDLEDAVAPSAKQTGRDNVRRIMNTDPGCPVQVRINGKGTPWHEDDLQLVTALAPAIGVRLPKCEEAREVRTTLVRLGDRRVHPLLESALGVENAYLIAQSDPRVASVGLGEADLRAGLGVSDESGLAWARGRVVNAAAAAQLPPPVMSAYTDVRDLDGLAESCARGKALGFFGRTAIHPAQLPIIRAAFTPTDVELARARSVLTAWESANRTGNGALATPDGTFVDAAVVRQAQRVVETANQS